MISMIRNNLIFSEGLVILLVLLASALIGFLWFRPLLYVSVGLLLFCFYFFRNPERIHEVALHDSTLLLSPADGRVVDIQFDENNGLEGYAYKISIFLSVFNVHVNRMPCTGVIEEIKYKKGVFVPAYVPKSSELNERNDIIIRRDDGSSLVVRQIAGIIARRIRCWVRQGSLIPVGSRYGMIKFGSRVDIFLPACVDLSIVKGQRVYGGSTIIGRWICK
jgi:phosphatidylserine decarboxylase